MVQKSRPGNLINDCKWCGKTNVAKAQPKMFCGPRCYQRWKRARKPKLAPVKCLECGEEFVPIRGNHVRCSEHCRYINQLRYQVKGRNEIKVIERKPCVHCGQLFTPARYTVIYCSSSCKQSAEYRPPRKKIELTKRDINECDLKTSAFADEIAEFKEAGGQVQTYPTIPNPPVPNTRIRMKVLELDTEEWAVNVKMADLDMFEDFLKNN